MDFKSPMIVRGEQRQQEVADHIMAEIRRHAADFQTAIRRGIVLMRTPFAPESYFGDWSTRRTITLSPDHTGGFASSQYLN